jgi:hypothetical protein
MILQEDSGAEYCKTVFFSVFSILPSNLEIFLKAHAVAITLLCFRRFDKN